LTWTELLEKTGLRQDHLSSKLRVLVEAKVLVYEWDKQGRAVYRLPRKESGNVNVS
jgi:DNA-binding transcriptional regulator GbsR (MarR family)